MTKLRFLGLDVHAETIAVAIAEPGGEVRPIGTIPNRRESIRKMIPKLGPIKDLRASICCLAVAPTISGRASGQRRRAVRWDGIKGCYDVLAVSRSISSTTCAVVRWRA